MSNPIHVVMLLLVLVVIWIGPAILAGRIAERKGREFAVYVIAGLIVGPLVLLISLVLPRRRRLT
ncbi:MAG TPA: hypothetical protein VGN13_12785 [Solirubrobacteraceae bacterium]